MVGLSVSYECNTLFQISQISFDDDNNDDNDTDDPQS